MNLGRVVVLAALAIVVLTLAGVLHISIWIALASALVLVLIGSAL